MRIKNILKLVAPSFLLGACAAGGASSGHSSLGEPSAVGSVEVSPIGKTIPIVDNPRLPNADRHFFEIRDEAGEVASATVRFCVAPDGHVEGVNLLRGSSSNTYNRAVVKDVYDWEFGGENFNPSGLGACEVATINYRTQL